MSSDDEFHIDSDSDRGDMDDEVSFSIFQGYRLFTWPSSHFPIFHVKTGGLHTWIGKNRLFLWISRRKMAGTSKISILSTSVSVMLRNFSNLIFFEKNKTKFFFNQGKFTNFQSFQSFQCLSDDDGIALESHEQNHSDFKMTAPDNEVREGN